jgi:hypothetical protein
MDFSKLGQGHRIAAGAGLLLLIDLWLSWYSINDDIIDAAGGAFGLDTTATAWQAFDLTDILLFITAIVAIAAAVQSLGLLRLPLRLSSVLLPLASVMTLWVIYRIINQPEDNKLVDVSYGAWLGLVFTAAVAYGAMKAQSEPEAVGPADFSTGGSSASTTTAPPASTSTAPPPPAPAAPVDPTAPAATTPPPAPPADDPPPPASTTP